MHLWWLDVYDNEKNAILRGFLNLPITLRQPRVHGY